MSHRADSSLGSTSGFLLCNKSDKYFLQESNRVKTETSPASDRPRYASCATDRRGVFRRRRADGRTADDGVLSPRSRSADTEDGRGGPSRTEAEEGWPQGAQRAQESEDDERHSCFGRPNLGWKAHAT